MSYNTPTLLDSPVLTIKKFLYKNNSEIDFLENLSAFLTLKIEDIDRQRTRYGTVHLDVWFYNLHIGDEKEITFFDFCGNG